MTTKERVLELLHSRQGQYISGQELGDTLHMTRSAIWKAMKALRAQGYTIDAVTNLGYRLPADLDTLNKERILEELQRLNREHITASVGHKLAPISLPDIHIDDVVESTNDAAKEWFIQNPECQSDQLFIANEQTNGRGRRGRSFYSAPDTGVYMTLVVHPNLDPAEAVQLTGLTAAAVAEAIEEITQNETKIKWVNDIYVQEKKVAGILTEGTASLEDCRVSCVVIGIGINLFPPVDGFPKELQNIAGSVYPAGNIPQNLRNRLIAAILNRFYQYYRNIDSKPYLDSYRSRSYLEDKWVRIHPNNTPSSKIIYAKVIGIDEEMHLVVEHENGMQEALSTGEVSVAKY